MCDALVINKADGDNVEAAKRAKREYANALHLFPAKENGWVPQVKTCSALEKSGLEAVWEMITDFKDKMSANGHIESNRQEQRVNWMQEHVRYLMESSFFHNPKVKSRMEEILPGIKSGKYSAIAKARELVELFLNNRGE